MKVLWAERQKIPVRREQPGPGDARRRRDPEVILPDRQAAIDTMCGDLGVLRDDTGVPQVEHDQFGQQLAEHSLLCLPPAEPAGHRETLADGHDGDQGSVGPTQQPMFLAEALAEGACSDQVDQDVRVQEDRCPLRNHETSSKARWISSSDSLPGHWPKIALRPDRGPCGTRGAG